MSLKYKPNKTVLTPNCHENSEEDSSSIIKQMCNLRGKSTRQNEHYRRLTFAPENTTAGNRKPKPSVLTRTPLAGSSHAVAGWNLNSAFARWHFVHLRSVCGTGIGAALSMPRPAKNHWDRSHLGIFYFKVSISLDNHCLFTFLPPDITQLMSLSTPFSSPKLSCNFSVGKNSLFFPFLQTSQPLRLLKYSLS